MVAPSTLRNVGVLATCQALFMSGQSLVATIVALVGFSLADVKSLATLPLTLQFLAMMLATIPASLLTRRIGRRVGLMVGLVVGIVGAGLAIYAILLADFWLFGLATALYGASAAFGQLYRFAAAEAADEAFRSRAISLVLAGGVVAAFIGPSLATWTRDLLAPAIFAGSYGAIVVLQILGVFALLFLDMPPPVEAESRGPARPLGEICRQPVFIVAALSAMLGYAIMNLAMTSTPLAMAGQSHTFADTAFVIQWHVVGMFAPSFVTGSLIRRFGELNIIATGALLSAAAVVANLSGETVWHFWTGLFLIGIGWNFMFTGGTTLLTTVHSVAERAKTQAANDFLVFGTVALSSLSSGAAYSQLGWAAVNYAVIPLLFIVVGANLWLRSKRSLVRA